jgi:hypothetical protein
VTARSEAKRAAVRAATRALLIEGVQGSAGLDVEALAWIAVDAAEATLWAAAVGSALPDAQRLAMASRRGRGALLADLRAKVEALWPHDDSCLQCPGACYRADVLALLDEAQP